MRSYFNQILQYGNSEILPMHMPGHKRKPGYLGGVAKWDVTEVTGLDDLHHPTGLIAEAMAEAAALCGSDETFFLVNGSSAGILSAITAATTPKGKILLARNCHKSAVNAVVLRQLEPIWVEAEKIPPLNIDGSISPESIENALRENGGIEAVLIVSPTYEGVVSDVAAIAKVAHRHRIPLIVDAAHGAHFRFSEELPADALSGGADVVIESLHKTLPALTQTAVLHVNGSIIDREHLRFALQTFQSSSPSHLLIASAIECYRVMAEHGDALMKNYLQSLRELRAVIAGLGECALLEEEDAMAGYDPGKIVFGFRGYHGGALQRELLQRERVEVEMSAAGYLVAMTSLYDSDEDLFRFGAAVKHLRQHLPLRGGEFFPAVSPPRGRTLMLPAEALSAEKERVPLKESVGLVAGETLYLYPPGSPLIAAGEEIREELISAIIDSEAAGNHVHGAEHGLVAVVCGESPQRGAR